MNQPFSTALDIKQDSSGFLWIGTEKDVFRFDGKEFVSLSKLTNKQIQTNKYIGKIYIDQTNTLWIFTGQNLFLYNITSGKVIDSQLPDSLFHPESHPFCDITEDSNGNLWLGYANGIYCKQRDPLVYNKIIDSPVAGFSLPDSKYCWIYTPNNEVELWTTGGDKISSNSIERNIEIINIMGLNDSLCLIGTKQNGLYLYNTISNNKRHLIKEGIIHKISLLSH